MCKKRTPLSVAGLLVAALAACGGEELTNCDEVTGIYYPEFEFVAEVGNPGECADIDLEQLDLTEDDLTVNTGTSYLNTRVLRYGCEVQVTYRASVVNPGDPTDRSAAILSNNGVHAKYMVEDRGVLRGEAVFSRLDRNGEETCRALFMSTWLPDDVAVEMMAPTQ